MNIIERQLTVRQILGARDRRTKQASTEHEHADDGRFQQRPARPRPLIEILHEAAPERIHGSLTGKLRKACTKLHGLGQPFFIHSRRSLVARDDVLSLIMFDA